MAARKRALSELPYQQALAGLWEAVYQTLTSPSFLEARFPGAAAAPASDEERRRVRVEDLHALIADIDMVRRQMPDTA